MKHSFHGTSQTNVVSASNVHWRAEKNIGQGHQKSIYILAKLQEYLRRKGDHVTARRWDVGDVCTVIERCGVNLSSGSFCIVPKAPNLPYIPDNCILVTTTEARQRTAAWKKTTASTSIY